MNYGLSIGEAARQSGLNTKTIRFYEEVGLISPAKRRDNNYRSFGVEEVRRLKLIKKVRDLGLPIEEIKKLLNGCGEKNCTFDKFALQSDLDKYVDAISKKINELAVLKSQLETLRTNLKSGEGTNPNRKHCCNLLAQLSELNNSGKGGDL